MVLDKFQFGNFCAFAVADGLGGRSGGELASKLVIERIQDQLTENPTIDLEVLFSRLQTSLAEFADKHADMSGLGTTLSLCVVRNNIVDVGHVGDTRVYHLRNTGLQNRTKDQTELQKLLDEGVLTKARSKKYSRKHVLLSALTDTPQYMLHQEQFAVLPRDRVILCTDGVYNAVPRMEVRDISLASTTMAEFADNLRRALENAGAKDDYSAVCAEFVGE